MKIIACECPCCGSNLDINSDTEFLKCDYCGAILYVEKVNYKKVKICCI